ncbi:DUF1493 family protein, partial [Salmonella enterica]|uniref:DUF1493 family protein n=1 Tax=Salmonella enterica TaxID=28901 RepID=UPI001F221E45
MDILLMDTIQQEVLALFREEIPGYLDSNWKEIPLELDSDLFEAPGDDLHEALDKFEKKFNVLNLQSKCNKKRSTHQLEYNFVSTQKPFPNDEYFLPTSYNKRA